MALLDLQQGMPAVTEEWLPLQAWKEFMYKCFDFGDGIDFEWQQVRDALKKRYGEAIEKPTNKNSRQQHWRPLHAHEMEQRQAKEDQSESGLSLHDKEARSQQEPTKV